MSKKIQFVLLFFLSVTFTTTCAQTFPRGIPEGEDIGYENLPQKASLTRSFHNNTPARYSLKQFAPTPGSQGQFGTCTGWAVAYAARTIIEAQKNGWTDQAIITEKAFSPTYQYRQASNHSNCKGAFTSEVIKSLKTVGSVPMKEFYVDTTFQTCF